MLRQGVMYEPYGYFELGLCKYGVSVGFAVNYSVNPNYLLASQARSYFDERGFGSETAKEKSPKAYVFHALNYVNFAFDCLGFSFCSAGENH